MTEEQASTLLAQMDALINRFDSIRDALGVIASALVSLDNEGITVWIRE